MLRFEKNGDRHRDPSRIQPIDRASHDAGYVAVDFSACVVRGADTSILSWKDGFLQGELIPDLVLVVGSDLECLPLQPNLLERIGVGA